jgi:hypothetical protein
VRDKKTFEDLIKWPERVVILNDFYGDLEVKKSRAGRQSVSEWQNMESDDQNAKMVV